MSSKFGFGFSEGFCGEDVGWEIEICYLGTKGRKKGVCVCIEGGLCCTKKKMMERCLVDKVYCCWGGNVSLYHIRLRGLEWLTKNYLVLAWKDNRQHHRNRSSHRQQEILLTLHQVTECFYFHCVYYILESFVLK